MLISVNIRNIVLIEQLELHFHDGLCALTGETGAGKSILLDSLGLAIGERAEARLVRRGTDQAQVSATFEPPTPHPVFSIMSEAGLSFHDGEPIIVRRTLKSDGKSRAFINDQPVTVSLLKQVGHSLLEIHGQFETYGLLNPSTHGALLDEYADVGCTIKPLWDTWHAARKRLQDLEDNAETMKAEEEFLRQSLEDLDGLAPEPGEEETLSTLRSQLMHRDQVMETLSAVHTLLSGDDDPLAQASGMLHKIADKSGEDGQQALAAIDRAISEAQDALIRVQDLSSALQESEHDLESIDERLYRLRGQARKHGCSVDGLAALRDELAEKLNQIEHEEDTLAAYTKAADDAKAAFISGAQKVRSKRLKAGERLSTRVQAELGPLKMDKAQFTVQIDELPEERWHAGGMDSIQFLVATNPGSAPGPLNKIASGGEMARFMLALRVVMASAGTTSTLIFDEVDAGVGGAVADAVGERLAKLSKTCQTLVVTHAPQIAARADHQWIVTKSGDKTITTDVVYLEADDKRREEIARMLSGASITSEARAAADKLLKDAA